MSRAASRIEVSASRSPLWGDGSVFCDPMVKMSGEVSIRNIRKDGNFRGTAYTLNDLTQYNPQDSNKADARRWIESTLGRSSIVSLHVVIVDFLSRLKWCLSTQHA